MKGVIIVTASVLLSVVSPILPAQTRNPEFPVQCVETQGAQQLRYGEHTIGCTINPIGDQDRFEFEGEAGDQIRVSVDGQFDGMDPRVDIRDPDGESLANTWCEHGCSYQLDLTLDVSGTYTVLVWDARNDETGGYSIQVERIPPPFSPPCLLYGSTVPDRIDTRIDLDYFTFEAEAGTEVRLAVNGHFDSMDPRLEVRDPNGATVASAFCDHGCSYFVPVLPEVSGTYLVMVSDARLDEVGAYTVGLDCVLGDCPIVPGIFDLVPSASDPRCVDVVVKNGVPIRGGEIGIAYDSSVISSVSVEAGPDLPAESIVETDTDPALDACPNDPEVDRGFTIGWVNPAESLTPASIHHLFTICCDFEPGVETCSPLKFVECLGDPPVRNVVVNDVGDSIPVSTVDHTICSAFPVGLFRRGDANDDGVFDVGDPVTILICLFLGISCPDNCQAASDANDDGEIGMEDAIYLINWRFKKGPPPPPPFASCNQDPTTGPGDMVDCFDRQQSCR